MPVTDIRKDPQTLTMTVTCNFDAPVERVWELWADPRQLERWWGPPTYPATVEEHDLRPGGRVTYVMTGPEGDRHRGYWEITAVTPPHRLVLVDGFAEADGTPNPELPTTVMQADLAPRDGGGTTMTIASRFGSLEQMEQLVAMGMDEGLSAALGQIDVILAGS